MTTTGKDKLPRGHKAGPVEGTHSWDKARCAVCSRELVWVQASGVKTAHWQHRRLDQ